MNTTNDDNKSVLFKNESNSNWSQGAEADYNYYNSINMPININVSHVGISRGAPPANTHKYTDYTVNFFFFDRTHDF